jgi:hypothetical protein
VKTRWSYKWHDYPYGVLKQPPVARHITSVSPAHTITARTIVVSPKIFVCGYCGRDKYNSTHHRNCPLHVKEVKTSA